MKITLALALVEAIIEACRAAQAAGQDSIDPAALVNAAAADDDAARAELEAVIAAHEKED